jgi:hypothetical protein
MPVSGDSFRAGLARLSGSDSTCSEAWGDRATEHAELTSGGDGELLDGPTVAVGIAEVDEPA